jgi:hypothetical protein
MLQANNIAGCVIFMFVRATQQTRSGYQPNCYPDDSIVDDTHRASQFGMPSAGSSFDLELTPVWARECKRRALETGAIYIRRVAPKVAA